LWTLETHCPPRGHGLHYSHCPAFHPKETHPMTTPSPDRRDFLKTAAATASTAALASAAFVHAAVNDTLKVGLIGCGSRGTGAAEQALRADRNAKLWAMGDAFRDKVEGSLTTLRGRTAIRDKISVPASRQFVGF